jgi:glycosyltransferase involved in cell wall biosynthesis
VNILYTIPSIGVKSGGPSLVLLWTVRGLLGCGARAKIVTFQILDTSDNLIAEEDFIYTLPAIKNKFAFSRRFRTFLLNEKYEYDIFHAQGIWSYPTYITAKIARKYRKPYLITPHGALYPQDLARGRWKKQLFLRLCLFHDMQKAACLHVTCMEELKHIRKLGVTSPIAVIPNPIDVKMANIPTIQQSKIRIGYLGRLHPIKNIERIIYAWHKLGDGVRDKELVIIGSGDETYHRFLKREVTRLDIQNVVFTGFLQGEVKDKVLRTLSYLVVPSDFENFGMVVPEALMRGVPVIASKGTPWAELQTHHCGWWVDNDIDTLVYTIREALSLSEAERIAMGKNGQKLIREIYAMEAVASKMSRLYEWILNGGERPEFVYVEK